MEQSEQHARVSFGHHEDDRRVPEGMGLFWLALVVGLLHVAAVVVAFMVLMLCAAGAHEAPSGWAYPLECCSNRDCGMLPKGAVRETPHGFIVTVLPGQHDMVKDAPVQFLIPYGEEKISPDGAEHICLSPTLQMLCFFTGSKGF